MKLRANIWIALALGSMAAAYFVVDGSSSAAAENSAHVKKVRVATVETASDPRQLRFSGITRAAQRARLAFSLGARLQSRDVEVGDVVKRGQVLARLDDREVKNGLITTKAALAEAQARRAQLERDVERVEKLVAAKAATAEELEKTRAGLESLRAGEDAAASRLHDMERMLGETSIRAPFDGTVTEVLAEPGEFVGPGKGVLLISGQGDIEVEVELPETLVPQLQPGAEVAVTVAMLGDRLVAGKIRSLGRSAAGPGQLFPVVVALDKEALVPAGVTAELGFRVGEVATLSVPVGAVVDPGGRRPAVFKIEGAVVRKVQVEVGSLLGGRVTVRSSLVAGDLVVVGGQRGLLDGDAVEVEK